MKNGIEAPKGFDKGEGEGYPQVSKPTSEHEPNGDQETLGKKTEDEDLDKQNDDEDMDKGSDEDEDMKKEEDMDDEDKKKKKQDDDEDMNKQDDDEDEDMKKQEGLGEDPDEAAASSQDENSSTSPGAGVPSTQNVAHGNTQAGGDERNANTAASPSNVEYSGKSANPDLRKSPLFVELSKQIGGMHKALSNKIAGIEKSVADRLKNIEKTVKAVEKFYNNPFYKMHGDNDNFDATASKPVSEQVKTGEGVRYSS